MKLFTHPILSYFSILSLLFILSFCSKSGSDPGPTGDTTPNAPTTSAAPLLSVSAISPTTGPYGTTVVITGVGFSTIASNNSVAINGKTAEIIGVSTDGTTLTIRVPKGLGSGLVTVSVDNKTATGPSFEYELTAIVSTIAGSGLKGNVDGKGINAQFGYISGIGIDANGTLYVADIDAFAIRKITPDGVVSRFAGTGKSGTADGTGNSAGFSYITDLIVDVDGNGYVCDNGKVRKFTSKGVLTTIPNISAKNISADKNGILYLNAGNYITKRTPDGIETTVAGTINYAGTTPVNGTSGNARFAGINCITVTPNSDILYVGDGNNLIRQVNLTGVVSVSTAAGSIPPPGLGYGVIDGFIGKNQFNTIKDFKISPDNNLYIADIFSIRKLILKTGEVRTVAGQQRTGGFSDGDGATNPIRFLYPSRIAIDQKGIIYVADAGNYLVRRIVFE